MLWREEWMQCARLHEPWTWWGFCGVNETCDLPARKLYYHFTSKIISICSYNSHNIRKQQEKQKSLRLLCQHATILIPKVLPFRIGPVVWIPGSHPGDRGSIPRFGIYFSFRHQTFVCCENRKPCFWFDLVEGILERGWRAPLLGGARWKNVSKFCYHDWALFVCLLKNNTLQVSFLYCRSSMPR